MYLHLVTDRQKCFELLALLCFRIELQTLHSAILFYRPCFVSFTCMWAVACTLVVSGCAVFCWRQECLPVRPSSPGGASVRVSAGRKRHLSSGALVVASPLTEQRRVGTAEACEVDSGRFLLQTGREKMRCLPRGTGAFSPFWPFLPPCLTSRHTLARSGEAHGSQLLMLINYLQYLWSQIPYFSQSIRIFIKIGLFYIS